MTPAQIKWHKAHKKQKKEYDRAYRQRNAAKKRAAGREWYRQNRAKCIAKAKVYALKNPDKKRAAMRRYAAKHSEKIAAKTRAWYQKNRPKALLKAREVALRLRYGLTAAQYLALVKKQGYRCKICNRKISQERPPVDHCHKSGKVRGVLCYRCNTGLGMFLDSPSLLSKAKLYLEENGLITV